MKKCVCTFLHKVFHVVAARDDAVLVSRAVNLKIDNITLKPAGKDTHTQMLAFNFLLCHLHITSLIARHRIYTPTVSVVTTILLLQTHLQPLI